MNRYVKIFFSLLKLVTLPVLNFTTLFLGIKFYGKTNWGAFISISIWVFFIAFIAKWAGQNYLMKEFSKNTSNYLNVFYSNFVERSVLLLPSVALFFVFPFPLAFAALVLLVLMYIYNSYDALLVYNQKFEIQFVAEIIGVMLIFSGFLMFPVFNLMLIIYLFSFSYLVKSSILFLHFNHSFSKISIRFSFRNLLQTFPFFLIGFSGWLASKCDIYVVSYFFSKKELSEYQIFISCFLILQAIPAYLILPINTHLFRLTQHSINKIKGKLLLYSFPIILLFTILFWIVLDCFLDIQYSIPIYFFGALSTLPTFIYVVDVLLLYKQNKENYIMKCAFSVLLITIILMLVLLPYFRILGVIISVCVSQWLYLFFIIKENKNETLKSL